MSNYLLFSIYTSCTEEDIQTSEPATLENQLLELKDLQKEVLTSMEPLKNLSSKELEALSSSTDIVGDIKKYNLLDIETLQKKTELFAAKMEKAKRLGASDSDITEVFKESAKESLFAGADHASSVMATPCYDAYEADIEIAVVGYVLCAVATSEMGGFILCSFSYSIAEAFAEKSYRNCMEQYK